MNPQTTADTVRAVLSTAARWQEELWRFSLLRINRYCDLSSRLRQCRSPAEALSLQSDFFRQMIADYGMEGQALTRELLDQTADLAQGNGSSAVPSYESTLLEAQQDAARIIEMAKDQAARIIAEAHERVTERKPARNARKTAGA
jgi:hypothetical protein